QATPDGGGGSGGSGGMPGGNPMTASSVTNAAAFSQPLDAVPSRDGTTIYFTAFDASGAAQVWKVAATGGAPTAITTGGPLEVPTGLAIAPDDTKLYIADLTAARGGNGTIGGLFVLALPAGGTPQALSGGDAAIYPIAIAVSTDGRTLFFTGATAADDAPA